MVQHLLLMMVAPPLLWLGAPLLPLLRGLPAADPRLLGRPAPPLATAAPALRPADPPGRGAASLRRQPPGSGTSRPSTSAPCARAGWHYLQHVCFLGSALLFWYPVVRPYPGPPALVALAAVPLPDPGRRVEHRPLGPADVLRPGALSALRASPPARGPLGPGRSVGGRRAHVGARLGRVPAAAVRDRAPAPVRPKETRRTRRHGRPRRQEPIEEVFRDSASARCAEPSSRTGFDLLAAAAPGPVPAAGGMPGSRCSCPCCPGRAS